MKYRNLVIALAVLLSAVLACGPLGGVTGSTPEAGGEATPSSSEAGGGGTAAPTAAQGDESPAVDSDALAGLNSYRSRVSTRWTPETGAAESWVMEQEYTREPMAQRLVMTAETGGTVEWVQIGDTAWYCGGGTCIQTQQSAEDAASSFGQGISFDPASYASDDAHYEGRETINGVEAKHYSVVFDPVEMAFLAQGEASDVAGDFWVADESGLPKLVVRYQISWKEKREEVSGAAEFIYEVYDLNADFVIEPPEGAGAGLPEDVPAYANASELTVMSGMVSFSTTDDVATVAEFYRTELPNQGWTLESDDELGQMVTQEWSKEGRELSVMISSQEGGGTSVLITLTES